MTNSSLSELGRSRSSAASLVSLLCVAAMAIVLLASGRAFASSYAIKTPEVTENSGEWHIKVRIDLSRAPSMMHTPMRFTFSKEAVDERAIMSKGAEPQHHRVVLETAAKQIVSLDVDFADPSGKVFKSTYFEFDLQRKDGYFEAGEYLVTLSGPDGDVGTAQKLTLKGDNPPVYRGAMDFAADPKAPKQKKGGPKIEAVSSGLDAGPQEVAQNDTPSSAGPASTDVAAGGPAPDMVPKGAFNKTAEEETVQDHPSGCGCVVAGAESGSALGAGAAALLGLAFVFGRRRDR
jgi:MYXO-CTERM domain-containing protein